VTGLDADTDPVSISRKGRPFVNAVLEAWRRELALLEDPELAPGTYRSRWGQDYNIEQMLEHAVVHPMRHRIQLERTDGGVHAVAEGLNQARRRPAGSSTEAPAPPATARSARSTRPLALPRASSDTLDVWDDARAAARDFWERASDDRRMSTICAASCSTNARALLTGQGRQTGDQDHDPGLYAGPPIARLAPARARARHLARAAAQSRGRGGGWQGVRDAFRNWVMVNAAQHLSSTP